MNALDMCPTDIDHQQQSATLMLLHGSVADSCLRADAEDAGISLSDKVFKTCTYARTAAEQSCGPISASQA